jgi:hypothetical protein
MLIATSSTCHVYVAFIAYMLFLYVYLYTHVTWHAAWATKQAPWPHPTWHGGSSKLLAGPPGPDKVAPQCTWQSGPTSWPDKVAHHPGRLAPHRPGGSTDLQAWSTLTRHGRPSSLARQTGKINRWEEGVELTTSPTGVFHSSWPPS